MERQTLTALVVVWRFVADSISSSEGTLQARAEGFEYAPRRQTPRSTSVAFFCPSTPCLSTDLISPIVLVDATKKSLSNYYKRLCNIVF